MNTTIILFRIVFYQWMLCIYCTQDIHDETKLTQNVWEDFFSYSLNIDMVIMNRNHRTLTMCPKFHNVFDDSSYCLS